MTNLRHQLRPCLLHLVVFFPIILTGCLTQVDKLPKNTSKGFVQFHIVDSGGFLNNWAYTFPIHEVYDENYGNFVFIGDVGHGNLFWGDLRIAAEPGPHIFKVEHNDGGRGFSKNIPVTVQEDMLVPVKIHVDYIPGTFHVGNTIDPTSVEISIYATTEPPIPMKK